MAHDVAQRFVDLLAVTSRIAAMSSWVSGICPPARCPADGAPENRTTLPTTHYGELRKPRAPAVFTGSLRKEMTEALGQFA
ncbi:hypothetical protein [Streptomyces silvisoli]|uniref:Uncharacterized protein n=1 Tax=Streptomyces silvisoli TaxID=3034235 RepID=A0ABT5ZWY2_9ACTN|nr:hypothetical protein [Streptomyces silvisoli]MDF3294332.1 hypothetical protein [Streptomyces silvisoli]